MRLKWATNKFIRGKRCLWNIKKGVVQNTQKLCKKQKVLFQNRNKKDKRECCFKDGTTKSKSVVPKMEQQNQKVLFQRWNNKTKKCCSEDGTTKPKSVVLKMEQQNQKVLFWRWNIKTKKCCSEYGTAKPIKICCSEDGTPKPKSVVSKME